jgi:hypothetical protein
MVSYVNMYPIPWSALTYDKSRGGFRTNVTEQQLKDAPEFSDDAWQDRDWETRTHRHYGAQELLGSSAASSIHDLSARPE